MGDTARNGLFRGDLGGSEILRSTHDLGAAVIDIAVRGQRRGLVVRIQRLVVFAGDHVGIAQQLVVVGTGLDHAFAQAFLQHTGAFEPIGRAGIRGLSDVGVNLGRCQIVVLIGNQALAMFALEQGQRLVGFA